MLKFQKISKVIFVLFLLFAGYDVFIVHNKPQDLAQAGRMCYVPIFKQWESYWAKNEYGYSDKKGTKVALMEKSGCGPTAMAMILSYWTGKYIYPNEVADYCLKNGYRPNGGGTSPECFIHIAQEKYGFKSGHPMTLTANQAKTVLKQGYPVLMTVGDCEDERYTSEGHYIVLTKIIGDTVYINDPNQDNTSDSVSNIFNSCYRNGFWF